MAGITLHLPSPTGPDLQVAYFQTSSEKESVDFMAMYLETHNKDGPKRTPQTTMPGFRPSTPAVWSSCALRKQTYDLFEEEAAARQIWLISFPIIYNILFLVLESSFTLSFPYQKFNCLPHNPYQKF